MAQAIGRRGSTTHATLDFAWDAGSFRADHVMAAVGLTRSSALASIDNLIALGLVEEQAPDQSSARLGRPPRQFILKRDAGVVLGVDAGEHQLTAVVADLLGDRLETATRPLPQGEAPLTAAERRQAVVELVDQILGRHRSDQHQVRALAIGVPAPVDDSGHSPKHPSGFWGRMNADLGPALADRFDCVQVENDGSLAALAEAELGVAQAQSNFIAMLSGRRLGSGVFLGGRLLRGAHGGVGELEGMSYVTGVGSTSGLGQLTEAWVREAVAAGRVPPGHPWLALGPSPTAERALTSISAADQLGRELTEYLGARLGRICGVVARFYDPALIVVCGAIAPALGEVIAIAERHLANDSELPAPRIVASNLAGNVVSLGAIAAARDAARQHLLSKLTPSAYRY